MRYIERIRAGLLVKNDVNLKAVRSLIERPTNNVKLIGNRIQRNLERV